MNTFSVGHIDKVRFFDATTYQELKNQTIPIPLLKSETREKNEVVSMQKNHDGSIIACISGKNLVMKEQKGNQLFVYKVKDKDAEVKEYELI